MTNRRPTDQELAATARKAVEDYRYATELPYFLDEDSCEFKPFMLILRSVLAEHGGTPRQSTTSTPNGRICARTSSRRNAMTDLSPAAQAVLDAYLKAPCDNKLSVAAALRAVVDQCQIQWNYHPDYPETEWVVVASDLLTIADELEGQGDG